MKVMEKRREIGMNGICRHTHKWTVSQSDMELMKKREKREGERNRHNVGRRKKIIVIEPEVGSSLMTAGRNGK